MISNNQQQLEEQVKSHSLFVSSFIDTFFLVSIITILVVVGLSFIHIATFQSNTLKYDYAVDWDHDTKLKINVDMTIAMSCGGKCQRRSERPSLERLAFSFSDRLWCPRHHQYESDGKVSSDEDGGCRKESISIDQWKTGRGRHLVRIVSSTTIGIWSTASRLQVNSTAVPCHSRFTLVEWSHHRTNARSVNWSTASSVISHGFFREVKLDRRKDACRLHGTLEVNKLAGNFHIILGK